MLIIFSGPPAAGKSTIARRLAPRLRAVWLRIDTLETPIMAAYGDDIADVGYRAAYGVAEDNLRLGHIVIADCVNDRNAPGRPPSSWKSCVRTRTSIAAASRRGWWTFPG